MRHKFKICFYITINSFRLSCNITPKVIEHSLSSTVELSVRLSVCPRWTVGSFATGSCQKHKSRFSLLLIHQRTICIFCGSPRSFLYDFFGSLIFLVRPFAAAAATTITATATAAATRGSSNNRQQATLISIFTPTTTCCKENCNYPATATRVVAAAVAGGLAIGSCNLATWPGSISHSHSPFPLPFPGRLSELNFN